ncbi:recombinase family protein [Anaerobium acetethylicum]|uniref:Site-specific DNA recombinase n=1 Tax=Anaerobium acetethylicum TaxID=1619234 RepID=A0A1D3TWI7_9FIRM|nr:recombinase family protein [Anaerobium acetethylicum]SCP98587.1 Site-specific DNA recombinase [Anaerobium acetethylicum]
MGIKELDSYRTGMYLRLSSGDDDRDGKGKVDSNSITNQKLLIEDFIKTRPEFKLADMFVDDGFTGSNFERPGYQHMMKAVEQGRLDCIIVKDLSRIAREHIGGDELILKTFDKYGVRFIAITDNFDSLTADHGEKHIIIPMKNLINDNYCHDISIKVRSSQQVKRANGEFVGAFAPYGYTKADDNKNQLISDEYAAGIVQDIFAKKLAGMSASAIANDLNTNGVLSPMAYKKKTGQKYSTSFQGTGDPKWSAQTIGRILKDEVYVGVLAQGKRTRINHKVMREVMVPKCDWIIIENSHVPIVSRADFDAVQILMNRDTKAIAGQKESYIYGGLLYCGDCGTSMVRRSYTYRGKQIVNYICSNYNRNGKGNCTRHAIREEVLSEIILGQLQSYIDNMRDCEKLVEHLDELNVNYDEAVAHDKEIAGLKAEITKYAVLKSSLYNDLQDEIITKEQFVRYREIYTVKEAELEEAVKKQEKIIHGIYNSGLAIADELAKFRENFKIEEMDRIALVTFVDRILIYEDTVEIIFKYSNEMEKVAGIVQTANELTGQDALGAGAIAIDGNCVLELKGGV